MDTKTKIKEEDPLTDNVASWDNEFLTKTVTMKTNSDTVLLDDDCDVIIKTEIKSETTFPKFSTLNDSKRFIKHLAKENKFETVTLRNNCEIDLKTEIEEQTLVLGSGSQKDRQCLSEDLKVQEYNSDHEVESKMEIKVEPWWLETETSSVGDVIEDGNLPAVNFSRLHTEATPRTSIATPYLEEKNSSNCRMGNLGFAESNVQNIYGSDISEISSVEQAVGYHMSKPPHDYKESDKLNNCGNSRNKLHFCEICNKGFSQWNHLKDHILIHEGKRPFKCDVCGKRFTQNGHLKTHILVHQSKRSFKCDVCRKDFLRKADLKIHMLIHQDKRPFICDACGKDFLRKGDLKKHILIHQDQRPFKCDVCGKDFLRKGVLNIHILIHQDKKPYKCDVCGKYFREKGTLNKHILIHQGKKPFKCDVCEKRFTQKGNLNKHIVIHQGKTHSNMMLWNELYPKGKFEQTHSDSSGQKTIQM